MLHELSNSTGADHALRSFFNLSGVLSPKVQCLLPMGCLVGTKGSCPVHWEELSVVHHMLEFIDVVGSEIEDSWSMGFRSQGLCMLLKAGRTVVLITAFWLACSKPSHHHQRGVSQILAVSKQELLLLCDLYHGQTFQDGPRGC